MIGLDGNIALLYMAWAHLCVKRKTTTANKNAAQEYADDMRNMLAGMFGTRQVNQAVLYA